MKDSLSISNIKRRAKQPTNNFWKKVQLIGGAIATVAGAILAAPIVLPAAATTTLVILATVGTTAAALGQVTTKGGAADGDAK